LVRREPGPGGAETVRAAAMYVCPRRSCRRPSLAFFDVHYWQGAWQFAELVGAIPAGTVQPMDGLPDEIEQDRLEAWSSLHAGNLRAAIIMGRASLQRAVRGLEAEGDGLKAEIKDLVARGKITADLRAFADEVRIAGDDAAHPSELGEVTRGEADVSLRFLDDFLRVAIAMPKLAAERKAGRKQQST
jgi:hypothetical protein